MIYGDPFLKESDMHMTDVNSIDNSELNKNILHYIFFQYRAMCKSHYLDIQKNKLQYLSGGKTYQFISVFLDRNYHSKIMLKKVSKNGVIRDAFQDYLISTGLINAEMVKETEYLGDALLLKIFDQIWIQMVVLPHLDDLVTSINKEVEICHLSID
ncbi:MAG: hypothetical protein ACMG6E_05930 [Candidatus Roizmanbacteria bacterium]